MRIQWQFMVFQWEIGGTSHCTSILPEYSHDISNIIQSIFDITSTLCPYDIPYLSLYIYRHTPNISPILLQDGAPQLCLLVYKPHELVRCIYQPSNSATFIRQLNAIRWNPILYGFRLPFGYSTVRHGKSQLLIGTSSNL